ncbi:MAG TPA: hypothetical protein VHC19_04155 [Pirellulales bacterium]|nr:hypothetical protein [Pirellulales bacterium]
MEELNVCEARMAWQGKSIATYSGGSGQMAVMGELLHRKCNAAVPHVDVGTDVFAFRDDREDVARIQVKTAVGKGYKKGKGYNAKFGIPMHQLERTDDPPLFYALAVRLDKGWGSFIVVSRAKLQKLWNDGLGSENKKSGDLELHMQFRPQADKRRDESDREKPENERVWEARCGKFDLTDSVDAWESLPPLKGPVAIALDETGPEA